MAVITEADTLTTTTKATTKAITIQATTTMDQTPPPKTITSSRAKSTAIITMTRTAKCSYRWYKMPAKTTETTATGTVTTTLTETLDTTPVTTIIITKTTTETMTKTMLFMEEETGAPMEEIIVDPTTTTAKIMPTIPTTIALFGLKTPTKNPTT
eukprot:176777-Ditylum_brightwellii.AAC.1